MVKRWAEGDEAMIMPDMTPCVVYTVGELLIVVRLGTKQWPSIKPFVLVSPIQLVRIDHDGSEKSVKHSEVTNS